jgi:hypothetical protein
VPTSHNFRARTHRTQLWRLTSRHRSRQSRQSAAKAENAQREGCPRTSHNFEARHHTDFKARHHNFQGQTPQSRGFIKTLIPGLNFSNVRGATGTSTRRIRTARPAQHFKCRTVIEHLPPLRGVPVNSPPCRGDGLQQFLPESEAWHAPARAQRSVVRRDEEIDAL